MSQNKLDIKDLTYQQLSSYIESKKQPSYRAKQIFDWIYKKSALNFDEILNISPDLRNRLKSDFDFLNLKISNKLVSEDGTIKILFELLDAGKIETVLIPSQNRSTICVSSQVGCKYACKFCASGLTGFKRNLTCAEILSQILFMKNLSRPTPITNIVFMGIGEPLDNYDNVLKAIKIINSKEGLNIAARKITISTCGIIPKIEKLSYEGMQFELAVSLHGSNDEARTQLMPVNKQYPILKLIEQCKQYIKLTKRQITFEYILIKDLTCTEKAAKELGILLKGMLCKINLIPFNEVSSFDLKRPSKKEIIEFKGKLDKEGILSVVRTPRGEDITAACGQLRYLSS